MRTQARAYFRDQARDKLQFSADLVERIATEGDLEVTESTYRGVLRTCLDKLMPDVIDPNEFHELLGLLIDDQLTPDQHRRLEAALLGSEENVLAVISNCRLQE